MIDLHIHTTYSDGADSLIEVLKKAEKIGLTHISITDHDNCKAYKELASIDVKKYYTGTIIPGIEIKGSYKGRLIEVLGYKIDTEKMQEWSDEFYKDKTKTILQQKYFDILCKRCEDMGLILSKESIKNFDSNKEWANLHIYNELVKHEENKNILPEGVLNSFDDYSKGYCGNTKSKLYIDKTEDYPSIEEAVNIIKQCGGLVFVPHIYIYKWAKNKEEFIQDILNTYDIDGIECMHSEFNEEEITRLLKLCKERHYFRSGGSDYHGKNKIGIELGRGKGNLQIPEEFIEEWK